MPRVRVQDALEEKAERDGDLCSCGAVPAEEFEPYCMSCGTYWRDVDCGLFSDHDWESV